jgi:hypothetical protein
LGWRPSGVSFTGFIVPTLSVYASVLTQYFFVGTVATMNAKRGRPAMSDPDRKARYLQVRVTDAELETFGVAADIEGMAVSAWVRNRLRAAAKKELAAAGKEAPISAGKKPNP